MSMRTNRITLLVHEIESAISFYTHGFGLQLIEDTQISESKRIVRLGCTTTDVPSSIDGFARVLISLRVVISTSHSPFVAVWDGKQHPDARVPLACRTLGSSSIA